MLTTESELIRQVGEDGQLNVGSTLKEEIILHNDQVSLSYKCKASHMAHSL